MEFLKYYERMNLWPLIASRLGIFQKKLPETKNLKQKRKVWLQEQLDMDFFKTGAQPFDFPFKLLRTRALVSEK